MILTLSFQPRPSARARSRAADPQQLPCCSPAPDPTGCPPSWGGSDETRPPPAWPAGCWSVGAGHFWGPAALTPTKCPLLLRFLALLSAGMEKWCLQTKPWVAALHSQVGPLCRPGWFSAPGERGNQYPDHILKENHPLSRTEGSHSNRPGYVRTCSPLQVNICWGPSLLRLRSTPAAASLFPSPHPLFPLKKFLRDFFL